MTLTADTNQHYDSDPRIFALFLDPMRKYSSGLYESDDDTLAQAQVNKLHYVAGRLRLRGGERLLDIGCGWGALTLFMAAEYGCQVVGLTPAARQREFILEQARERGLADKVDIRLGHFERTEFAAGSFDAVTMLGSIVHMPDLGQVYRRCHEVLRRDGMLYVSESCFRNHAKRERFGEREGTAFVRDAIFGWGDMRPLSDLVAAAEDADFSVAAVDDLTDHYRRTIDDWLVNVRANAAALDQLDPGASARLTDYLETANAGWGYTTKHYALICRRGR